ncbi:MAG: hypothetical protein NUV47_01240 [Patescibacteria group bacterium]|nr:hypothetical protein [Patescibacteria group bacterium]
MTNNEPIISYPAMRDFLRCEKLYYYTNILWLERIERSDALKIEKYVDSVLSQKEVDITEKKNKMNDILKELEEGLDQLLTKQEDEEAVWLSKAKAIIEGMNTLEITKHIVNQDFESQKEFMIRQDGLPQIHGFIDFHHVSDRFFLKLKTAKKIDDYKQDKFKFQIEDQCGMYFLSNPAYEFCVILPIKIPELEYNENKETIEQYYNRCLTDITNRPRHYFVNYNYETKKFGIKLYRQEINENELIKLCKWTAQSIQRCAKENYWPMRKGSCFSPIKCDFYEACSIGISEDRYKKREKL